MNDVLAAILSGLAGLWVGVVALMARTLQRDQSQDSYLAWRRSKGTFWSFGYGPRAIAFQAVALRFITLVLFGASGFFALRALISR